MKSGTRNLLFAVVLLAVATLIGMSQLEGNSDIKETILLDRQYLEDNKRLLDAGSPTLTKAYEQLIFDAENALLEGPFSVTDKKMTPPSRDPHDYASYSRYWWPDPTKPDGLPYIRRDGETYPGSQSGDKSDRPRIGKFGKNTEALGLAYFFTKDLKYAEKAAEMLRVWFLDEDTHMNPNLNHAQCRLGHNEGSNSGVLDGRLMVKALETSLLIAESSVLSEAEYLNLKSWCKDYLHWLTTNELAIKESKSENNHGSYYDAQALYFALYSEDSDKAKQIAESFIDRRILTQISPDGAMPHEVARTRPLFYSIYNLHAIFLVASMAEKIDIDLWKSSDKDTRLRSALDDLVPYADPSKLWPNPTIGQADRMELYPILLMANQAYPESKYLQAVDLLSLDKRRVHRANLALPLMR